jgi:hypothetical protein
MSCCSNVNVTPIVIGGGNGSTAYDAFGRLRTSTPYTLFDSKNILSKNSLFDESLTGSGTVSYSSDKSTVSLNVTTASGDKVIRETKRVFSYQPGKSLLNLNTFIFNTAKTNLRQRVGYFEDNNGIILQQNNSEVSFILRTSTTGTVSDSNKITQANWNGDKLDGTGASGFTLDLTKTNIFFTDIEWLGVGSVRVGFVINGQFIVAHTFHNANSQTSVYMKTPNLPIRYEIENTGATASSSVLQQICSTVMSEGGYEPIGIENLAKTADMGTGQSVGTSYVNLVTIRMKSGRTNAVIVPSGLDILNISNVDFEWSLLLNGTPNSAFAWTSYSDNIEYSLEAKTMTSGTTIASGYVGGKTAAVQLGDGTFSWSNQLGRTISGTSDTLTLMIKAASASKAAAGILRWYDI